MFTAHIGDDLELRLLEERHAQALFEVIDRDREDLRTWLPWVDGSQSAEDTAGFIRSVRQEFAAGHDLTGGIWHHGHPVGTIGLRLNPPDRAAEIGYWLARDARGQGIMTRATRALITYAFDELGLHRIVVRCAPGNRASCAIPERLGFTLEGTLREAQWINDHFSDLAVYAILCHEWDRAAQSSERSQGLSQGERMALRVDPLRPGELTDEQRQLYDRLLASPRATGLRPFPLTDGEGRLRGPFNAMLLSPQLGNALQELGTVVRYGTGFTRRQAEIAILVVAAHEGSQYEWQVHRHEALLAGLTEAQIAAIQAGGHEDAFTDPVERTVLTTTRELIATGDLTDESFAATDAALGLKRLYELVTLVGYYRLLADQLRLLRIHD